MRETIFRGKRCDNGEWVYGDLIHYKNGEVAILQKKFSKFGYEAIEISRRIKVIPETVGQFTGLTDKNGTKIFECDVLRLVNEEYIVRFGIAGFELLRKCVSTPISAWYGTDAIGDDGTLFEVIGNIHDQGVQ